MGNTKLEVLSHGTLKELGQARQHLRLSPFSPGDTPISVLLGGKHLPKCQPKTVYWKYWFVSYQAPSIRCQQEYLEVAERLGGPVRHPTPCPVLEPCVAIQVYTQPS